jgi:hypothetical protein
MADVKGWVHIVFCRPRKLRLERLNRQARVHSVVSNGAVSNATIIIFFYCIHYFFNS